MLESLYLKHFLNHVNVMRKKFQYGHLQHACYSLKSYTASGLIDTSLLKNDMVRKHSEITTTLNLLS
jgi:hypothetical protein